MTNRHISQVPSGDAEVSNTKILVIESSPHRNGSSNMLAMQFVKGAQEAGHSVSFFDAGHGDLHPCNGCNACANDGNCIQKDGMAGLRDRLLRTDLVVFITPLYYFGMSAQLKMVIDRFYSFNSALQERHLQSILIVAAWNSDDWTMEALQVHYKTLCRYLNFTDRGAILATGCGTADQTRASPFMQQAFELGKML